MRFVLTILALCALTSCDFYTAKSTEDAIARVNDNYLYKDDIKDLVGEGVSSADSLILVNNYINRWATQQLLIDGAELNLNTTKQDNFNKLVEQYKTDLFTKAYLEALVNKNLNTEVSLEEAKNYYNDNKEAFKLNEELIKLRYINVLENRQDLKELTQKFKRYDSIDKQYLDSISIQFKSFSLQDSIWVKVSQVFDKIPVFTPENKNELLKKSNLLKRNDSISLYLVRINDVLLRNDIAPLEYVKPTIDKIVINKRKLDLIKQLKKDITKDAIKNKTFEIYN